MKTYTGKQNKAPKGGTYHGKKNNGKSLPTSYPTMPGQKKNYYGK